MATYYFIGGTSGSFSNPANWSATSGGPALASLTWADGDTAVINPAQDTTATVNWLGVSARINLKLPGTNKNSVVTLNVDTDTLIGNYISPTSGTTLALIASAAQRLKIAGHLRLYNALSLTNITGIEFCGSGSQAFYSHYGLGNAMDFAAVPFVLNKTTGSVLCANGPTYNNNATTISAPRFLSLQPCPELRLNDYAGVNSLLGTNHELLNSTLPFGLAGDCEIQSLVLCNGLSATHPTALNIPSGATLKTGSTSWGTNCLIDGENTNTSLATAARNSFGTYCTTCTDGVQDDADDTNYNVGSGITKACTPVGPPQITAPTITATATGTTTATLSGFTSAEGETVTSWAIRYATTAAGLESAESQTVTPIEGVIEITGLTAGTTYYWQAKAIGDGTNYSDSTWSAVASATTQQLLTSVTLSTDSPIVGTEISSNLAPAGATASFQWSRCDTNDGTYTNISGAESDSYTPALSDTGYYLRITATGTGSYTGTATATTDSATALPPMATYYFIGGTSGAFSNAADWSATPGGPALASLTWADGDTAVIDPAQDTTATVNWLGVSARINLQVPGTNKNSVVVLNVDTDTLIGNLGNHLSTASGTSLRFTASAAQRLKIAGHLQLNITLFLTNITGIEFCGSGSQAFFSYYDSGSLTEYVALRFVLNKTTGSVLCANGTGFNNNATVSAARFLSLQPCPELRLNDYAGVNSLLGTSHTRPNSTRPFGLAGDCEIQSLVLCNGISATHPTALNIPSGATLKTGSTSWGTNCLIDGENTNTSLVNAARNSFGTYCTTCTDSVQDDADDPNYNVGSGITKACTPVGPFELSAPSNLSVALTNSVSLTPSFAAIANASSYTLEYTSTTTTVDGETVLDWTAPTSVANFVSGTPVTDLTTDTTYYFRVKSIGDGTNYSDSDWSAVASAAPSVQTLAVPTGMTANADSQTQITVAFTPNANAVSTTLEYSVSAAFTESTAFANFASGSAVTGLAGGTNYYFRLKSIGDAVHFTDSGWSDIVWTTTPDKIALPVPEHLTVAVTGDTSLNVAFDSVSHAESYALEYTSATTQGSPNWAACTSVSPFASGTELTELTTHVVYYFRVKAIGDGTNYSDSDWSAVASARFSDPPTIKLYGGRIVGVPQGGVWIDAGAYTSDDYDSPSIITPTITNSLGEQVEIISTAIADVFTVSYTVTDSDNNTSTPVTRTVFVITSDSPTVVLSGEEYQSLKKASSGVWTDAGATATDTNGNALTITRTIRTIAGAAVDQIPLTSTGQYLITYFAVDTEKRAALATRIVTIVETLDPDEPSVAMPVKIRLNGYAEIGVVVGRSVIDPGATATSVYGETLTVVKTGAVNTGAVGIYPVTYMATDSRGNTASVTRNWYVTATDAPKIVLLGNTPEFIGCGTEYWDDGAKIVDADNQEIAGELHTTVRDSNGTLVEGGFVPLGCDTWTIAYFVTVGGNDAIPAHRTVITDGVFIELIGENQITLEVFDEFTDPGAAAYGRGNRELDVTRTITNSDDNEITDWDTTVIGTFVFTYSATNENGVTLIVTRTVNVVDTQPPIVELIGNSYVQIEAGTEYTDAGATATDLYDGPVTPTLVITDSNGTVVADWDTYRTGNFTFTYTAIDSSGNVSESVARTVYVVDTQPPTLTINGDNPVTIEVGTEYTDAGATATDLVDGQINVESYFDCDFNEVGTGIIEYSATDSSGNSATGTRIINVVDTTPPVVTFSEDFTNDCEIDFGQLLSFESPEVSDSADPNPTEMITMTAPDGSSTVMRILFGTKSDYEETHSEDSYAILTFERFRCWYLDQIGTYALTVTATDASGNSTTETRTIVVSDPRGPKFETESTEIIIEIGDAFDLAAFDAQVTAIDNGVTLALDADGNIDATTAGVYTRIYSATSRNNITNSLTRTVYVVKPMTIFGDNPQTWPQGRRYTDSGATAWNPDGTQAEVYVYSVVNPDIIGEYTVMYKTRYGEKYLSKTRTVNVVAQFNAYAESPTRIKIMYPYIEGETYELRRQPSGSNPESWETVGVGIDTAFSYDDITRTGSTLVPNTKYDYQCRITGGEWSETNVAWLTETYHHGVTVAEYSIQAVELAEYAVVACEIGNIIE